MMPGEPAKSAAAERQRRWRARRKRGARACWVEISASIINDWIARGWLPDAPLDDDGRIREIAEALANGKTPNCVDALREGAPIHVTAEP